MKKITAQIYKERILSVLIYIQQNLDEELNLEKLADIAHFSPFHFHRIFKGMVGESLKEHIRRLRLERAASHLKLTNRSVTRIAFDAGYETHESFSRSFKDMFGLSPSGFRTNIKPESIFKDSTKIHYNEELANFEISKEENMEVQIKKIEPIRVAFVRNVGPYKTCGQAWDKLCTWMGAHGLISSESSFIGLCHDDPEVTPPEKIRYDACITVDEDFSPAGEIGVQVIQGGEYAVTTHFGPYEKLSETYASLCGKWAPQNGREFQSAPSFEIYFNSPENTDPEDLVTDIYVLLES